MGKDAKKYEYDEPSLIRRELTPRELECLRWASQGKSAEEIAMLLEIGERTVASYLQNAKEKLNAVKISQAVYIAVKRGLL